MQKAVVMNIDGAIAVLEQAKLAATKPDFYKLWRGRD
jgi:hypothetical protein